jgi:branched-chain amino acid transport system substrate-binding protein
MTTGAELAVKQVNQRGGLKVGDRHYAVKLAIADDKNSPEETLAAAQKLQSGDWFHPNTLALISSPQSSLALPLTEGMQSLTLPLITLAPDPKVTFPSNNTISIGLDHRLQGAALATFAVQTLKAKRVALLYTPDNYYSRNLVTAFQHTLKELGETGAIVATYGSNQGKDFRPQLQTLAQQKPDVLLLPNSLPDLISQGQQIQELKLTIPILGGDSWASFIAANLPLLEGGFFLSPWHPQSPTPQSRQFVEDYTRAYRQPPRNNAALSYDAVQMILGAIATQGELRPEAILQRLQKSSPFLGVTGDITVFPELQRSVVINRVQHGEAEFYQIVAR